MRGRESSNDQSCRAIQQRSQSRVGQVRYTGLGRNGETFYDLDSTRFLSPFSAVSITSFSI